MNALAASLVLAGGINLLGAGCSQSKPAYTPAEAKACAAIEAEYMSRVLAACPDVTYEDCAAVKLLKADRAAEQVKAGCR